MSKPVWVPESESDERLKLIADGHAADMRSTHARIIADKVLTARKANRS